MRLAMINKRVGNQTPVLHSRSHVPKARAITNRILLQHIQGMRHALAEGMDSMEKRMDSMDRRMTERFTRMDERFCKVDSAFQRLYTHRVSMLGRIQRLEKVVGIV
jgi:phosphoribulokinase